MSAHFSIMEEFIIVEAVLAPYKDDDDVAEDKKVITIQSRIIINALPRTVFHLLTDLPSYADWNPWVIEAEGLAKEGEIVQVKAHLSDKKLATCQHKILSVKQDQEFSWCDVGWSTSLVDAQRVRYIEQLENGRCCVVSALHISGPMARAIGMLYGCTIQKYLVKELIALAGRAELMSTPYLAIA